MKRICSLIVLTVLLLSADVSAQVRLTWKFPDGRKSTSVTDVTTNQTLSIAGMDIVTASSQKLTVSSVNGTRAADGKLTEQQSIDALQADIDINGTKLSFDSSDPDAPPPGTAIDAVIDVFKALAKSKWTVVRDKDNRAVDVVGRDAALASLPEAVRKATERQMDPVYLAQQTNDGMAVLPKESVRRGDTWNVQTEVRLEAGQTLTFSKTYTYAGTVEKDGRTLHRITGKTTKVDYDMDTNSPSPLKYISSELKVAESEGTTLFDQESGRVFSTSDKVRITGPMVFEAGGNQLPAKLDLTIATGTTLVK